MGYDKLNLGSEETEWTTMHEPDLLDRRGDDRGELLSQRPEGLHCPEERWIRRRPYLLWTLYILIAMALIMPFIIPPDTEEIGPAMFMMLFMTFVGTGVMVLGITLMRPHRVAERVYDNGVLVKDHLERPVYYPWGFFSIKHELDDAKGQRLMLGCHRCWVVIPSGMPGYDEWAKEVQKRVGKEEYMSLGPSDEKNREGEASRLFRWLFLTTVVGSTLITFVVYLTIFHEEGALDVVMIGLLYLWIIISILPILGTILLKVKSQKYYGYNAGKIFAVLVIVGLISYTLFTAGLMSLGSDEMDPNDLHVIETPEPGASTLLPGVYEGMDIVTDGPVKVGDGERMILLNTTLTFDPAHGLRDGLWVSEGGSLVLDNCTVTTSDIFRGFNIKVHGTATITATDIIGICDNYEEYDWDNSEWYWEYGFEVTNDDFTMVDCTVRDSLGSALLLNEADATVTNCTFYRSGASGIVLRRSNATIEDCTFEGCERGMNLRLSNATVTNCTFRSNDVGVLVMSSYPTISDCHFINCYESAVTSVGSEPVLQNITRTGTGNDISEFPLDHYEFDDTFFILAMVFMLPMMLLVMSTAEIIGERIKLRKESKEIEKV